MKRQECSALGHSRAVLALLLALTGVTLGGCAPSPRSLTLATTTSTRDSGLLDVLVPMFQKETGIEVKVVAVGSGAALELGRRGDADVLLTHATAAEMKFMAEGHGESREHVMHNDFVLVGPPADPAAARSAAAPGEAFKRIAHAGAPFVSRGDESGTHIKERQVWEAAGVDPAGAWYVRAGAGMAQALRMAGEMHAYTLSDRATWLAVGRAEGLVVVYEGDPLLQNPYSVIVVDPERHPRVHHREATAFAEFLESPAARAAISRYGQDRWGQSLFFVP